MTNATAHAEFLAALDRAGIACRGLDEARAVANAPVLPDAWRPVDEDEAVALISAALHGPGGVDAVTAVVRDVAFRNGGVTSLALRIMETEAAQRTIAAVLRLAAPIDRALSGAIRQARPDVERAETAMAAAGLNRPRLKQEDGVILFANEHHRARAQAAATGPDGLAAYLRWEAAWQRWQALHGLVSRAQRIGLLDGRAAAVTELRKVPDAPLSRAAEGALAANEAARHTQRRGWMPLAAERHSAADTGEPGRQTFERTQR
jgi:hypothetical protein